MRAGTGVVSTETARSASCTAPLTDAAASVGVFATGAGANAFAGFGETFEAPSTRARAFLDLSYEFTFHGPAGSGGRYQPCLTEEHNWFADGAPVTQASFDGIGSGGAERVSHDSWSSSSCEGGFNPATTREFTVGETLRARVILEVLVDARGRNGEAGTASFTGFRLYDDSGAPLSNVTWTLVPDVQPVPEPRTSLLLGTAGLLGFCRRQRLRRIGE